MEDRTLNVSKNMFKASKKTIQNCGIVRTSKLKQNIFYYSPFCKTLILLIKIQLPA